MDRLIRSRGIRDGAFAHLLLRNIGPPLIRMLGMSIRLAKINEEFVLTQGRSGRPCIFCFWHNRLLIMPYIYQGVKGRKNIVAMASMSKDGEFIADVLKGFAFEVVRGSSSHGGEGAVMEMASLIRAGFDAGVTPDGPRGPRYVVQQGVIFLSQMTGAPIVPATYDVVWKKRLRSWDRFIIPMPFSRGVFVYGDPMYISRDADGEEKERARTVLEETMWALNEKAAALVGSAAD